MTKKRLLKIQREIRNIQDKVGESNCRLSVHDVPHNNPSRMGLVAGSYCLAAALYHLSDLTGEFPK